MRYTFSCFFVASILAALSLPIVHALPLYPRATSRSTYLINALNSAKVLSEWYSESSGRWQNAWWNSANALTTLASLAQIDSQYRQTANLIFENTFTAAAASNGGHWVNHFYDDEGWWAMAWIKVYDVTGDPKYLSAAEDIYADLLTGFGTPCGGQWWTKKRAQVNSINNELFLAVAASLANRVHEKQSYYQDHASKQAYFLHNANLLNSNNTIVDGLTLNCFPEGDVFTYNQGVILGAYVEMHTLTQDPAYIDRATVIAGGALRHLVDENGILTEMVDYPSDDHTACQFKGIFARNLAILHSTGASPDSAHYASFLRNNADSIWRTDRDYEGRLGSEWQGPVDNPSAASHSSALDCLVAAAQVS